jgi:hypothetical protein
MCDQHNPTEIRMFKTYKSYENHLYALQFPDEWILQQKNGTGTDCTNCLVRASWRGVLIGYCMNCANDYIDRGKGFYNYAVEDLANSDANSVAVENTDKSSAFDTYLRGISLEDIGDIDFNPEHTIEEHLKLEEYLRLK